MDVNDRAQGSDQSDRVPQVGAPTDSTPPRPVRTLSTQNITAANLDSLPAELRYKRLRVDFHEGTSFGGSDDQ